MKDTDFTSVESGLRGFINRRKTVLRFLLVTGRVMSDSIVIFTLLSSFARAGLIYSINETAQTVGQGIGWSAWAFVISAVVLLLSGYQARLRAHILINRIRESIRFRMAKKLMRANIDFLLSRKHGQIYSGMTSEVDELAGAVVNVVETIEAALVVCIAIPYLFWISWEAGMMTCFAMMVGSVGYIVFDVPARRFAVQASIARAEFCNRVDDMLSGWKEIRLRKSRSEELEAETLRVIKVVNDQSLQAERLFAGSTMVGQSALVLLLGFVVILMPVLRGDSAETLFQVLTIVLLTNGPIESLFAALPRLSRAEAAHFKLEAIETALARAQSQVDYADSIPMTEFTSIDLLDVVATISESGKPDEEAFRLGPVTLSFTPGETVFICGGNGSGKTTLLSLIAGLRHPNQGHVHLDKAPLTPENIAGYRNLFSGVLSGFHLFDRTFGLDEAERHSLETLIVDLKLSDRVTLMQNRFSTLALSAGQRRRLALAVTLAEDRPIVILDEFAADQDPANRAFFYDVLVPELAASGKLVIAVTHDDHQFDKCDRLIKMEAGQIVSVEVVKNRSRL